MVSSSEVKEESFLTVKSRSAVITPLTSAMNICKPPSVTNNMQQGRGSFYGRLRHFLDVLDPRTVFLWEAQKVKQAILHPDTGEKIPMPFRMSGYIPFGTPVVVGLLLPSQTLASTIFWQWLNQSHNACVNYCTRNASKPTPFSKFFQGYLGAVSSAVAIAALLETAVTHVVLPMPILVLPPLLMTVLERLPLLQKHSRLVLPVHSLVCLCAFSLALPLAISLFPQNSKIHVSQLEPEISVVTECKVLTYNKGL